MRNIYLSAFLIAGPVLSLNAAPVSIVNASFEANVQAVVRGFDSVTPTGWTDIGSGGRGTFRPSAFDFNTPAQGLQSVAANNIPDGVQTFYSNGGDIGQVLTTSIGPAGTQYALSLFVGDRWDIGFPGYTVQLLAGASALASATNVITPAQGQFAPVSLIYTANGTESGLLAIRLINNGGAQINFDDVRLDATAPIPEPASVFLIGAGLTALALRSRRRLKPQQARR